MVDSFLRKEAVRWRRWTGPYLSLSVGHKFWQKSGGNQTYSIHIRPKFSTPKKRRERQPNHSAPFGIAGYVCTWR